MSQDKMPITVNGKKMLEDELMNLVHNERPSVIRAIEDARAQGDLSENAEYDTAKERQALIEGRIQEIQAKLAGAEVIDPTRIVSDRIVFGAKVELIDVESEEGATYRIVGIDEADVKQGRISILSPMARALIGRQVGDVVIVQSPRGEKEYEVKSFSFA